MPEEGSEIVEVRGRNTNVGVKLLAVNDQGKYLLIRKDPEKYPEMANKWDIPGGRWIPGKEVIPKTMERELRGETGLDMSGKPSFVAKQKFPHSRIKDLEVVRLTYKVKVSGNIKLSDEHTEHKWVTIDEMKNMDELDPLVKQLIDEGTIV